MTSKLREINNGRNCSLVFRYRYRAGLHPLPEDYLSSEEAQLGVARVAAHASAIASRVVFRTTATAAVSATCSLCLKFEHILKNPHWGVKFLPGPRQSTTAHESRRKVVGVTAR